MKNSNRTQKSYRDNNQLANLKFKKLELKNLLIY